jgi:hypothetical protein
MGEGMGRKYITIFLSILLVFFSESEQVIADDLLSVHMVGTTYSLRSSISGMDRLVPETRRLCLIT